MEHSVQPDTLSAAASEVRLVYTVLAKHGGNPDVTSLIPQRVYMEKQRSKSPLTNGVNGHQTSEKEWQKDSCILVMGSVKAGKSTTINLYTGSAAETGLESRITAETAEISFYEDVRHSER